MYTLPGYDAWKLAYPPEYDAPPDTVPVSDTGVCRCDAYPYPHRVGGCLCTVCPACATVGSECNCSRRARRDARRWYNRLARLARKSRHQ